MNIVVSPLDYLTPRQREVLHWLAEGQTNAEIAARLGISAYKVANHAARIYDRLGVRNRVEAAITYHVWAAAD
jgi:DNA-binding CsgD family transcriptional regulator